MPKTPRDFETLASLIMNRTGQLLSPTTLKRIWGYLDEPVATRRSTLDILAQFCGWSSYDDFLKGDLPEAESGPVGAASIVAEKDMRKGDRLRLIWSPSRVCLIEYGGASRWKVIEAEGTRLLAGDTFTAPVIASGEPLYLSDLVHNGEAAGIYVCGRRAGIRFVRE